MLAGYTIENWTLPSPNKSSGDGEDIERFSDTPKSWLPVYLNTSDPQLRAERDEFCNTCQFISKDNKSGDGREYQGGIVFMDEYSRAAPNVTNIIMGLTNEHKFGDNYSVASKWGFVFASNRAVDEGIPDATDDERYYPTAA